jgi:lipopolysaccharide transport system ATP-binding protein
MSDLVIRAEGLGKKYVIGHDAQQERYTALREVWARTTKRFARSALAMARGRELVPGDSVEEFWALKDVSFELKRGEVIGVIGRNGAGKSTLLKILSRITEPSAGRVEIKGRVASLLEVGTGFHPELTGRENIYLNGAILGMTRAEIKRKFDEIVAFAEIEKFLDTPVKRYSSGMYVRLAFAVAAHLEPEILVVDEVLAVGDAEFQRKCLGKMGDVAQSGRTILFVSHNMQAIRQLCRGVVWLENGRVAGIGADEVIGRYLLAGKHIESLRELNEAIAHVPADPAFRLREVDVRQNGVSTTEVVAGKPIEIRVVYDVLRDAGGLCVFFMLCDMDGSMIFESLHNGDAAEQLPLVPSGRYESTATIPADFLAERNYELQFQGAIHCVRAFPARPLSVTLRVHGGGLVNRAYTGYQSPGKIAPLIPWRTESILSHLDEARSYAPK